MSLNLLSAGAGATLSAVIDRAWWNWEGHTLYKLAVDGEKSRLSFLEHHHWGLALILLGEITGYRSFFYGAGLSLIASEATQLQPFGAEKDPYEVAGNVTTTGLLIGGILLVRSMKND